MSYGQDLLRMYLDINHIKYIENYRPDWLKGMELDFYLPSKHRAIEFNGDQHYTYTEFGSPDAQRRRDLYKKEICRSRDIRIIRVEAIDLEYTRLRGKGLKADKSIVVHGFELRKFNSLAVEYRKNLISRYGSPTARGKHSKIRQQAFEDMKTKYKR